MFPRNTPVNSRHCRLLNALRNIRFVVILMTLLLQAHLYVYSSAQVNRLAWHEYINLSNSGSLMQTTEPKVTSDPFGYVHVLWTGRNDDGTAIYYARYGGSWEGPVDVLAQNIALVSSARVDEAGVLHVIWMGANRIYHSRAHVSSALSARGWEPAQLLGDRVASASSFASDIVSDDEGSLYVVYGDNQSANVFVVRSEDGGLTWTEPQQIGEVGRIGIDEAATDIRIAHDANTGVLHLVWTARQIPRGWPGTRLLYSRSANRGEAWSAPLLVDEMSSGEYREDRGPIFPSVAVRTTDEIHVTWAGAPQGERWHQWSEDGGSTWYPKRTMNVFNETNRQGIPGTTGFTDMIVDSAGQLYAVTTIGDSGAPRIAHWSEGAWSDRSDSPYPGNNCEDPRLTMSGGTELHLVCVEQSGAEVNDVWHVMADTDAPRVSAKPLPVPVMDAFASITTETILPAASPTPDPIPDEHGVLFDPGPMRSNSSGLNLAIGILPSLLLVLSVVIFGLTKHRR